LIITADRGMAGAYSNAAIKEGDLLIAQLKARGLEVDAFLVGRKAVNFFRFRGRAIKASWTGFSDNPTFENAREVSAALITSFLSDSGTFEGVDELHIIYTRFRSMILQELPLTSSNDAESESNVSTYEFESSAESVLNALLPRYVEARVFNAMLQSAASEHAARRRAMKSATDNADDLIKSLTRLANAARQAEITQEISEIVGGADALASASAGSE
jgi:F-type H+-transporting ATPase subunit gamma